MKIGFKLGLAFGAIVVLLLILGGVSSYQMNAVSDGFSVDVQRAQDSKSLAQQIEADVLQVRRNEKDFLARNDLKYFDRGIKYLEKTGQAAGQLQQLTHDPQVKSKATEIQAAVSNFQQSFSKLAKEQKAKGLDEKSGLQGDFRTAAHNLDGFLQENDTTELRYLLLMMRRYEKDLNINQADAQKVQKYSGRFKQAVKEFGQVLTTSTLNDSVKSKLVKSMDAYAAAMNSYISTDYGNKKDAYGKVRAEAGAIEKAINQHYVEQGKEIYLSIRKDEKDYLLRKDSKYVEKTHKSVAALKAKIAASEIAAGAKQKGTALLDSYQASFDALVKIDGEIVAILKEMKKNADHAMALTDEIVAQTNELAVHTSDQINSEAKTAVTVVWIVGIISVLAAVILAYLFARSISVPMNKTVAMLAEMTNGHLTNRLHLKRADEIGQMADSMDEFADSLQTDVVANLKKLATGDLTFDITPRDGQDEIRGAIQQLGIDLNEIVGQIQIAGEQIASGSGQVSDASQSLSQGATEQASSLEEISASLNETSAQTSTNAENANQANQLAGSAQKAAQTGSSQMAQMVAAMGEINEAGQDISKIIKTIDEIAFQTNLLALNAAVEAARAGQHGKGFAVVAEEVRNLAARSAKAAAETAELIQGSVEKTENGSAIANQTAESLHVIVDQITKVTDLVSEIAAASSEQAQGISQINQGISQIDTVTQQNTASAEESAAAAEELNGQAEQLRQMLQRFTLKHSTSGLTAVPRVQVPVSQVGWAAMPAPESPSSATGQPGAQIALDDSEFGRF